jgi:hypothetical protein
MNHVVDLELIDLAGIELGEAGPHPPEERSYLVSMVRGDQLSGGTTIGLLR